MDFKGKMIVTVIFLQLSCEAPKTNNNVVVHYKKITANRDLPQGVTINGLKQGLWIDYDTLGHFRSSVSFLNGVENGEFRIFGEFGKLVLKVDIQEGKFNGRFEYYNENGKIYVTGNYKNNKKIGDWLYYDDNGVLTEQQKWNNGKMLSKKVFKKSPSLGSSIQ